MSSLPYQGRLLSSRGLGAMMSFKEGSDFLRHTNLATGEDARRESSLQTV
jgi:hypothetical protein